MSASKIKFTDVTGNVPENFYPSPCKFEIPEWMKSMSSYMPTDGNEDRPKFAILSDQQTNQTAKRCIPMMDALTSGYMIKLSHDINVTERDDSPYYQWRGGMGVSFHIPGQLYTHKATKNGDGIPKINNPWAVETPGGYSCLFTPPLNNEDSPIIPFSGIVDTDSYSAPVNFPFQLKEGFRGLIPAGTPLIQVLPFKRESWKMQIEIGRTAKINRIESSVQTIFRNVYRNMHWNRKSYS